MDGFNAGPGVEQFPGQVRGRPRASGREVQTAGFLFGQRHKLGQRLDANARMHHQHVGEVHAHGDGRQVTHRVVAQLHHVRRNRQRPDGAEQQRCAIARGVGDELVGNVAACARFVVHDHRLADVLAQFFGDQARRGVGRSARCKTDDQVHRLFGRKVLRLGRQAEGGHTGQRGNGKKQGAFFHVVSVFLQVKVQSAPSPTGLGWRFSTAWRSSEAVRKMPCANLP